MGDSIAHMITEARRKSAKKGYWCDGGLGDLKNFIENFDEYNVYTHRYENRLLSALTKEGKNDNQKSHRRHRHRNNNNSNSYNYDKRTIDVTPHKEKEGKLKRALLELLK